MRIDPYVLPPPLRSPLPPRRGLSSSKAGHLHKLCERYQWRCFYCDVDLIIVKGRKKFPSQMATRDHFIPKCAKAPLDPHILVACCHACNHKKANTPPLVFMASDWLAERRSLVGRGYFHKRKHCRP